jgi:hypothetical protein
VGGCFEKQAIVLPASTYSQAGWLDFDHDYDLDLFLLGATLALARNNGEAGFSDVTEAFPFVAGTAIAGVRVDVIADTQWMALAVLYAAPWCVLYRDRLSGTYEAVPLAATPQGGRDLGAFDYDLDSRLDMLQANGHIETEIHKIDPSQKYLQAAQLFWNAGPEHVPGFVLVSTNSLGDLVRKIVGRGSTFADLDGDGELDVVLTQIAGAPLVLRNDQDLRHHWLRVRLNGKAPNRDAIGAWIELTAGGGVQRRQVMPTRSSLSQVERTVTFGLEPTDCIDALKMIRPDTSEQTVKQVPVDQLLVLEQKS